MKAKTIFYLLWPVATTVLFCLGASARGIDVNNKTALTGKIVDPSNRIPVAYVSVALYSAADSSLVAGTIPNNDGYFSISRFNTGNYYLEISYPGCGKKLVPELGFSQNTDKLDLGEIVVEPADTETGKRQQRQARQFPGFRGLVPATV